MNQDVIHTLNELASQDIRSIPVDLIFQYHDADLLDQTLHSKSDKESKHLFDTKSHKPVQRLGDAPEFDNSTLESSPSNFDSRLQETKSFTKIRGGDDATNSKEQDNTSLNLIDESDDESEELNDYEIEDDKESLLPLPLPLPFPIPIPISPSLHLDTTRTRGQTDHTEDTDQISTTTYSRPFRIRGAPDKLNLVASIRYSMFHIFAKRAMREIRKTTEPAIMLELSNITRKGVLMGRHMRDLTPTQINGIIHSHINITPKYSPTSDGSGRTILSKVKARLVAGGDRQDRNMYSRTDITSPTYSVTGLFAHAALVRMEGKDVAVTNVACAYLNARMPKNNPEKLVFLRIDSFITPMLLKADSSHQSFVSPSGTITVELNRALFGCIESARLWFEELTDMGFLSYD